MRRYVTWKIAVAVVITAWLVGWVPAIIYSWRVGDGPQFYAVWIIIGPLVLFWIAAGAYGMFQLYRWAFARPSRAEVEERIAELERATGIGA